LISLGYAKLAWVAKNVESLHSLDIDTVGDLRVLSSDRVEKLALSPVVIEYLLRIVGKAK
jgi:hypothetical protein